MLLGTMTQTKQQEMVDNKIVDNVGMAYLMALVKQNPELVRKIVDSEVQQHNAPNLSSQLIQAGAFILNIYQLYQIYTKIPTTTKKSKSKSRRSRSRSNSNGSAFFQPIVFVDPRSRLTRLGHWIGNTVASPFINTAEYIGETYDIGKNKIQSGYQAVRRRYSSGRRRLFRTFRGPSNTNDILVDAPIGERIVVATPMPSVRHGTVYTNLSRRQSVPIESVVDNRNSAVIPPPFLVGTGNPFDEPLVVLHQPLFKNSDNNHRRRTALVQQSPIMTTSGLKPTLDQKIIRRSSRALPGRQRAKLSNGVLPIWQRMEAPL